jgi:hypothetical protein
MRFRPDGRPDGFTEWLDPRAPGAALTGEAARAVGERTAHDAWQIDLTPYRLAESWPTVRAGGRVDHTFVYERHSPRLNDGRYRLRLMVSGDRLTEVTRFVGIPEAFTRRYQHMRAANAALGTGATVILLLLCGVGGLGLGLFYGLRHGWVILRQPLAWGVVVAGLQLLAAINEWPLLWMTYDPSLPRIGFVLRHLAVLAMTFVGSAVFFGVSFMAAESLTRRAFGQHPQLWRLWSRPAGASLAILGRTVAGYLLVSVFLAYQAVLYFYGTGVLGWWTPAEALIRPRALSSYLPWLSPIANALQFALWEESLLRAVPLAGAALIGDRFGKRRWFVFGALILQAVLFSAGHATALTQPAYARALELIVPSLAFGVLYLALGLLPVVILHFAFDAFWFAMPLFVSTANGMWIDRAIVIGLAFTPLWIVGVARLRQGRWRELPDEIRNAAWTAPPATTVAVERSEHRGSPIVGIAPGVVRGCVVAGLVGLLGCLVAERFRTEVAPLDVTRVEADRMAREALAKRGVTLDDSWRVMPVPDDGRSAAERFVRDTAPDEQVRARYQPYLPMRRWRVRVARFEGNVADRAEEWTLQIDGRDHAPDVEHRLPEVHMAPSLDEDAARTLAYRTVQDRFGLDRDSLREVSARRSELVGRTEWNFTLQDVTVPPLPPTHPGVAAPAAGSQSEARILVRIAGTEVAAVRPFVSIPEPRVHADRTRQISEAIVPMLAGGLIAATLSTAAVLGLIAWTRRRFAVKVFLAMLGVLLATLAINAANDWPLQMARFETAQSLRLQSVTLLANACIGFLISAVAVALGSGMLARSMPGGSRLRTAAIVGVSLGLIDSAVSATTGVILRGAGTMTPDVSALGAYLPGLAAAIGGIPDLLVQNIVLLLLLTGFHRLTRGWTTRRRLLAPLLVAAGLLLSDAPVEAGWPAWFAAAGVFGLLLLSAYVLVLRHDLSLTPLAVGTAPALAQLQQSLHVGEAGLVGGALAGMAATMLVSWWLFRLLRGVHADAVPRVVSLPTVTVVGAL